MIRLISAFGVLSAGISAAIISLHGAPAAEAPVQRPVAAQIRHQTASGCKTPAPTSSSAYGRLWAAVDPSQWGGADVSISTDLPDGRRVWLYGDTLSTHGFVHSSAIVQDRGCLHVSKRGHQLLPDDDRKHVYWISSVEATNAGLLVTARSIALTGSGPWDFRDNGFYRTAYVTVSKSGDLTFHWWIGHPDVTPAPAAGDLQIAGPHHVKYGKVVHDINLSDGTKLVTTCQNWDDGEHHPLHDYQPIFSNTTKDN